MTGTYGIFQLVSGAWVLVSTWKHKTDAMHELAYLRDMLGIDVTLFVKL